MNWNGKDPLLLCTIARNARSRTAPALPGGTLFLPSTLENAVPVPILRSGESNPYAIAQAPCLGLTGSLQADILCDRPAGHL